MERLLCIGLGYVFGCLQFAYILGKVLKGIDIRQYGSGNAGTTNAIRVLGTKIGIATLVLDILKAVAALVIIALIWGYDQKHRLLWGGIGVVLGHNYPFYMQFRGGKGVAATIGIFLAADIRLLLIAGIPALVLLAITKYMSVASLTYMLLLVITTAFFYLGQPHGVEVLILAAVLALSGFWRHRGNIKRLLHGQEVKMGQKVSVDAKEKSETSGNDVVGQHTK